MSLAQIQEAIEELSAEEVRSLREWLSERSGDAEEWQSYSIAAIPARQPHSIDVTGSEYGIVVFLEPETREGRAIAQRYLDPLFGAHTFKASQPDVLVLGCTHFPLLLEPLRQVVGPAVEIVDSAATTAAAVERRLLADHALRTAGQGGTRFLATDSVERFARVGGAFLGMPLAAAQVELFDL